MAEWNVDKLKTALAPLGFFCVEHAWVGDEKPRSWLFKLPKSVLLEYFIVLDMNIFLLNPIMKIYVLQTTLKIILVVAGMDLLCQKILQKKTLIYFLKKLQSMPQILSNAEFRLKWIE